MDALENMISRPTLATLSATGAGKPLFMHSNPNNLYQMLFGGIASGDVKRRFEARKKVFDRIEQIAGQGGSSLHLAYGTAMEGMSMASGKSTDCARNSPGFLST